MNPAHHARHPQGISIRAHGASTSGVLEIRAGEGGADADSLTAVMMGAVLRWAERSGL